MINIGAKIHTLLNQLFSQVLTVAIHPSKIETIQNISDKLSNEIANLATSVSLEKCRLINEAIQKAFRQVAKDVAELEERVKVLEVKLTDDNK